MPDANSPQSITDLLTQPTQVKCDMSQWLLQQVIGDNLSKLLGSTTCPAETQSVYSTVFGQLLGLFNIAVVVIALCLLITTIWRAIGDTTRDGEAFGSQTDDAYTIMRNVIGIVLLAPTSLGGLAVINFLVLQIVVWGVAIANWGATAASSVMIAPATSTTHARYMRDTTGARQQFASAFQARFQGYFCKYSIEHATKELMQQSPQTVEAVADRTATYSVNTWLGSPSGVTTSEKTWSFTIPTAVSGSDCGTIKYTRGTPFANSNTELLKLGAFDMSRFSQTIADFAVTETRDQAVSAAMGKIETAADSVAQGIVAGTTTPELARQTIATTMDEALQAYFQPFDNIMETGSLQTVSSQLKNAITQNGWMTTPIWERVMGFTQYRLATAANGVAFQVPSLESLKVLDGIRAGSTTDWSYQTVSQKYERDKVVVANLSGAFASESPQAFTPGAPTSSTASDAIMQWFMNLSSGMDSSKIMSEPLTTIQNNGLTLADRGTAILAGGYFASLIPSSIGGAAEIMKAVGWVFLICGVLLGGILPFLPLLHFISGALAWFLMVAEAMIAAPLWCLLMLTPSRQASLVGSSHQGLLLMLGVLLRPIFLMIGLFVGIALIAVGLRLGVLIFSMLGQIGVSNMTGQSWTGALVISSSLVFMYVLYLTAVVSNGAGAITAVGDACMAWIGGGVSQLGRSTVGETVSGAVSPMGRMAALPAGLRMARLGQGSRPAQERLRGNNDGGDGKPKGGGTLGRK